MGWCVPEFHHSVWDVIDPLGPLSGKQENILIEKPHWPWANRCSAMEKHWTGDIWGCLNRQQGQLKEECRVGSGDWSGSQWIRSESPFQQKFKNCGNSQNSLNIFSYNSLPSLIFCQDLPCLYVKCVSGNLIFFSNKSEVLYAAASCMWLYFARNILV